MRTVDDIWFTDGKPTITVRCYAELNDFLPEDVRGASFTIAPALPTPIGSVLMALGIPDSNVDVVLLNGMSVSFSDSVKEGARLSVYPVFESFDIAPLTRVREEPLRNPRFILDVHLGKLASFMRMMGYDAMYEPGFNDDELVSISMHEERALLSKDRPLLANRLLTRAYLVRAIHPKEQLIEVLHRFDLVRLARPFKRCLECNTLLRPVSGEAAADELPPRVRESFHEFFRCSLCNKIFWRGSHYRRMLNFIEDVTNEVRANA
jgi:uncharacterized protein